MFNIFKKNKKEKEVHKSAKAAYDLVHSDAWADIQVMFFDRISDIQSIMNIDDSSVEKAMIDMKVRVNLAKELKSVLDEIIGLSNQYEFSYKGKKDESDYQVNLDVQ